MAPNVSKMDQNGSKWLQMALDRFNLVQISPKGSNLLQMAPNESKWPRIGSKLFQMFPNGTKFVKICLNWSKQGRIGPNGFKLVQTFPKGTKWVQMRQLGLDRSKWVQMGPQGSKIGVRNYHELNRMAFKPRSPGSCLSISQVI